MTAIKLNDGDIESLINAHHRSEGPPRRRNEMVINSGLTDTAEEWMRAEYGAPEVSDDGTELWPIYNHRPLREVGVGVDYDPLGMRDRGEL